MENININFNKVDMINVLSSAQDIKTTANSEITVIGVHIYETADKDTGEVKTVGAIKIDDGTIFGFTSHTLIECAYRIADVLKEEDTNAIKVKTIKRTSKSGRDFYQFVVTDII